MLGSHIGYGVPHKQDTAAAHGEPLGGEEIRLAKRSYEWPEQAKFFVPEGVYEHFAAGIGTRGADSRHKWLQLFDAYRAKNPDLATEIDLQERRELPVGWDSDLPVSPADPKGLAGRGASGKVLNILAQNIRSFEFDMVSAAQTRSQTELTEPIPCFRSSFGRAKSCE